MSEFYQSENQQHHATDMNQASNLTYFEPMTVGKILELSFKFFFRNFGLFFLITLLAFLPSFAMNVATNYLGLGRLQEGDFNAIWLTTALLFGTLLTYFVSQTFATAGLVHAVSRIYLGKKTSVSQAFSAVKKRFWSLALAQTIVAVLAGLGMLLCLIPGIYVLVTFMIVVPSVMLEPISGGNAIERTYKLIDGYRWNAFKILLVLFLMGMGIGFALSAFLVPLMLMSENPNSPLIQSLSGLAQTLSQTLSAPLGAIAATLLYYDMRIRKEGFDLELLEQSLGIDHP